MANYTISFSDPLKSTFIINSGNLDGPNATTTNSTLYLYGQTTLNWGANVNENQLRLLESFASASSPLVPIEGQKWYKMKLYRNFSTASNWTNGAWYYWNYTSLSANKWTLISNAISAGAPGVWRDVEANLPISGTANSSYYYATDTGKLYLWMQQGTSTTPSPPAWTVRAHTNTVANPTTLLVTNPTFYPSQYLKLYNTNPNIDSGWQLPAAGAQILSSDPIDPETGMLWFNNTTNQLNLWDGTSVRSAISSSLFVKITGSDVKTGNFGLIGNMNIAGATSNVLTLTGADRTYAFQQTSGGFGLIDTFRNAQTWNVDQYGAMSITSPSAGAALTLGDSPSSTLIVGKSGAAGRGSLVVQTGASGLSVDLIGSGSTATNPAIIRLLNNAYTSVNSQWESYNTVTYFGTYVTSPLVFVTNGIARATVQPNGGLRIETPSNIASGAAILTLGPGVPNSEQAILAYGITDSNFQLRVREGAAGAGDGTFLYQFGSYYAGTGPDAMVNFYRGGGAQNGYVRISTAGGVYQTSFNPTGTVTLAANPIAAMDATPKTYVDSAISTVTTNANNRVLRSGDTMTGTLIAPVVYGTQAVFAGLSGNSTSAQLVVYDRNNSGNYWALYSSGTVCRLFRDGIGDLYTFTSAGVATAADWAATSDRRTKTNIRDIPLDRATKFVTEVAGRLFDKNGQPNLGFIAQEVQPHFPEVIVEDSNGMLALNYAVVTAIHQQVLSNVMTRLERIEKMLEK